MRHVWDYTPAEQVKLNADAVLAFFRRVGGVTARDEVKAILHRREFCKPCEFAKLDGQPRWSLRAIVTWMAPRRPTTELERALAMLQQAEARLVSPRA